MPVSPLTCSSKITSNTTYNDSRLATFTTTGQAPQVLWGPSGPSSIGGLSWLARVCVAFSTYSLPEHTEQYSICWTWTNRLLLPVSILVTVSSLLRGPLMQRASFVEEVPDIYADTKILPIMPNITDGWAGRTNPATGSLSRFSPGFADVISGFQNQNPIDIGDETCDTCTLKATVRSFCLFVLLSRTSSR